MYKTQCTKSQEVKEKVRISHNELDECNFVIFNYCWRVVYKEDSQSMPARLVVDPTLSGLNILLAKGENNLGNIFDILTRSRINQFSWAADISKLYNMLHLNHSALPFSLFLYYNSMDS